jgi:hypothetical protein
VFTNMKVYYYQDGVFAFEGNLSVQQMDDWVMPWRINYGMQDFYPYLNEKKAKQAAGIRLQFTTTAENIVLRLADVSAELMLDMIVNGEYIETVTMNGQTPYVEFKPLPSGSKEIEIWLDQRNEFKVSKLLIDEDASICKTVSIKKRWVHYGSSISQSLEARSPATIWTALVARKLNLHLTNLGFHSECKCEPLMAVLIRDLPADFITLKVGINLVDGDLNQRTFKPAVLGLVKIIREKHPNTPLAVCSPIYSPLYDDIKGGSGYNLKDMRAIIAESVDLFRRHGDGNILYIDGLKLFGADDVRHMPDKLHPDADGQYLLADRFIKEVFSRFRL